MRTNLKRPQRLFVQPVRYEIPAFQRRYVWTQEEQWEPLWDDVEELAQSIKEDGQTEPHFMGAVVLQQTQFATATIERRIVVDGQQRLTTIQLLIDAVQEVLEDRGHSGPAKRLSALVSNGEEYRDGNQDHAFKVWPTAVDRIAFRHAMSNELSATDYAASRIVQAHEYFKGQAEQWLDRFPRQSGEHETAASALEAAVSRSLEIVVIDLGESDNPHVIFETLNARGTPLLQSDMVKNKVLQDAGIGMRDEEGGINCGRAGDLAVRPRRLVGSGSGPRPATKTAGRRVSQPLAHPPKSSRDEALRRVQRVPEARGCAHGSGRDDLGCRG